MTDLAVRAKSAAKATAARISRLEPAQVEAWARAAAQMLRVVAWLTVVVVVIVVGVTVTDVAHQVVQIVSGLARSANGG